MRPNEAFTNRLYKVGHFFLSSDFFESLISGWNENISLYWKNLCYYFAGILLLLMPFINLQHTHPNLKQKEKYTYCFPWETWFCSHDPTILLNWRGGDGKGPGKKKWQGLVTQLKKKFTDIFEQDVWRISEWYERSIVESFWFWVLL